MAYVSEVLFVVLLVAFDHDAEDLLDFIIDLKLLFTLNHKILYTLIGFDATDCTSRGPS